jgi:type I restriction-modification system DNA methylase subunit
MHVCLGMVFLLYLSAAFELKHAELLETPHADAENHDEYRANNVFLVPHEARWSTLHGFARAADVWKGLDNTMRALERENEFGAPPLGNASYGWTQHIFHHLAPTEYAVVILANGSMRSESSGKFLFLDARKLWHMGNRTQENLSPEGIAKLGDTQAWRHGKGYQDVSGSCKSALIEEIRSYCNLLTPGRYIGNEEVKDNGEPFEEKMRRLEKLTESIANARLAE